jgi:hypothetical protein
VNKSGGIEHLCAEVLEKWCVLLRGHGLKNIDRFVTCIPNSEDVY